MHNHLFRAGALCDKLTSHAQLPVSALDGQVTWTRLARIDPSATNVDIRNRATIARTMRENKILIALTQRCRLLRDRVRAFLLLEWYDRQNSLHLLASFAILTWASAIAYYLLSKYRPEQGLISSCRVAGTTFWDALYFSIATETTVGYGDLSPVGISRFVACAQVICGLVLAGMTVSKLSSGPGGRLRNAVSRCSGDWIEMNPLRDTLIVSLVTIAYVELSLRYDGENYDRDGIPLGFFKGMLLGNRGIGDNILQFKYSNRDSNTKYFQEGEARLEFTDFRISRQFMSYSGIAYDQAYGNIPYSAYRASEEESRIIHGIDLNARKALAKAHASKYLASL